MQNIEFLFDWVGLSFNVMPRMARVFKFLAS